MEDPGFQEQLAAVQKKKLLSDKEADFRQYLVRSGGAEELVKLLVGLQEAGSAPADPVAFIQHFVSTQELALIKGRPIDNIMALQEEGAKRAAKVAELEEALGEATAKVEAKAERRVEELLAQLAHKDKQLRRSYDQLRQSHEQMRL